MNIFNHAKRSIVILVTVFFTNAVQANYPILVEPFVSPKVLISSRSLLMQNDSKDGVLRSGQVLFDTNLIKTETFEHAAKIQRSTAFQPQTLTIQPFSDKQFDIILTEKKVLPDGSNSFSGRVVNSAMRDVSLVIAADAYVLTVDDAKSGYQYEIVGNTISKKGLVTESDPSKRPFICGVDDANGKKNFGITPRSLSNKLTNHSAPKMLRSMNVRPDLSGMQPKTPVKIDLLFVYDNRANNWLNYSIYFGNKAAFAQSVIQFLNNKMRDSQLNITFNLVHQMSVNYAVADQKPEGEYNPDSFGQTIGKLRKGDVTPWDEVHRQRDIHHADLVTFFSHGDLGAGGIAGLLGSQEGSSSSAYNVNKIRDAKTHVLIHELAHNLGAMHAVPQKSQPGPNHAFGDYAAGWYFGGPETNWLGQTKDRLFNTTMAYGGTFHLDGRSRKYVYLYSSPDLTYEAPRTWSWTNPKTYVIGDVENGDNRRVIVQTAPYAAKYRSNPNETTTTVSLDEALEKANPLSRFTTEGDGQWFGQKSIFLKKGNNNDAAQSPQLAQGEESRLITTINDTGYLSFYAANRLGVLAVYVNGELKQNIPTRTYNQPFELYRIPLFEEENRIEWRYRRNPDSSYDNFSNITWIDNVSFESIDSAITFQEALDNDVLSFESNSVNPWKPLNNSFDSGDDDDFARVKWDTSNAQPATLTTQISSQHGGQISFSAKVSVSETKEADGTCQYGLTILIDNVETPLPELCGNTQFTNFEVDVPAGEHVITWSFSGAPDDDSTALNTAWLDSVNFTALRRISIDETISLSEKVTCNKNLAFPSSYVICTTAEHYEVTNWNIASCRYDNTYCAFRVTDDIVISPTLIKAMSYPIVVSETQYGRVSCPASAEYDSKITCQAFPDDGYTVDKWLDSCDGQTSNTCEFTASTDNLVNIIFKPRLYNISIIPNDKVNILCTKTTAQYYSQIECQATPNTHSISFTWKGQCEGQTTRSCTFNIKDNIEIGVETVAIEPPIGSIFSSSFEDENR